MIPLSKVKELNEKAINKPNIILRSGDRWTEGAKVKGLKHKGLEYYFSRIPINVYNGAKLFGGQDYWDKDFDANEIKYMEDSQFRKDIEVWLKAEERKAYAKVSNSLLGR